MDDVVRVGLHFSFLRILEVSLDLYPFFNYKYFSREYIVDVTECTGSFMFGRESFTLCFSYFVIYLARVEGFDDESEVICFFLIFVLCRNL